MIPDSKEPTQEERPLIESNGEQSKVEGVETSEQRTARETREKEEKMKQAKQELATQNTVLETLRREILQLPDQEYFFDKKTNTSQPDSSQSILVLKMAGVWMKHMEAGSRLKELSPEDQTKTLSPDQLVLDLRRQNTDEGFIRKILLAVGKRFDQKRGTEDASREDLGLQLKFFRQALVSVESKIAENEGQLKRLRPQETSDTMNKTDAELQNEIDVDKSLIQNIKDRSESVRSRAKSRHTVNTILSRTGYDSSYYAKRVSDLTKILEDRKKPPTRGMKLVPPA